MNGSQLLASTWVREMGVRQFQEDFMPWAIQAKKGR